MTAEELLRQDVIEEYKRTRSYFKVASRLDMTMEKVRSILTDVVLPNASQRVRPTINQGRGRPEMEKYIVARKKADAAWENLSFEIVDARQKYMKGTHELATGYDGEYSILYAIPRTVIQPRPGYFANA